MLSLCLLAFMHAWDILNILYIPVYLGEQMMFYGHLRKVGNSYVVTVPKEEVARLEAGEGDLLAVHVQRAEIRPVLSEEVRQAFEESWEDNEPGYRYLKGR
jgi:antitoxin component of MazEF toxin-antitoxin module